MAKAAIQVKNLFITYNKGKVNEFHALKDVNADIHPREYIILFGPSGCGKSTLLYTMLGGVPPEGGGMIVHGEDIYGYTADELNKYQQTTIGIIYQQFNLISSISVLDNVALPMIFRSVPPRERTQRAYQLLKRFGIPDETMGRIPTLLSGGQQQRVAVSRALVNDPQILLADEPVGNLDSISAEQVMNMLADINDRERKTVILVTHDAKYLPYAHRIFYMRDGVLRRIVVNPEKEQVKRVKPGETIVTEIEQLARMYPYSEPMELKVKSVVNFATQSLGFSQLERLEKAILTVLKGEMDEHMFYVYLTQGLRDGGVGMHAEEASEVTRRVFSLFRYSHEVQRFRDEMHNDRMFLHQKKFIDRLYVYITEETGVHLTPEQSRVLLTAVAERISGIIRSEDFEERLALPLEMGGAAFDEDTAHKVSRYLEKLVAQGGYIILPNEVEGAHS